MGDNFFLIVGIIDAVIGLIVASADIFARLRCRIKAEGEIVSLKTEKTIFRGSTIKKYRPVISYKADKEYKAEAPFISRKKEKYDIGEKLVIYYNEKKPDEFYFRGKLVTLLGGLCIFLAGAALIFVYFI